MRVRTDHRPSGAAAMTLRPALLALLTALLLALVPAVRAAGVMPEARTETVVFAGGCFWGVEGVFEHTVGVRSATSGYAGGTTRDPSYEEVSTGRTGHAEAVRVVYDPARVSFDQLLAIFFTVAHDPTQLNRQGPDRGTQYRSALYTTTAAQRRAAQAYVTRLTRAGTYDDPIVTEIEPLDGFYLAEAYHQDYMAHHPRQAYIVMHDAPKVARLRREFPRLYREWPS